MFVFISVHSLFFPEKKSNVIISTVTICFWLFAILVFIDVFPETIFNKILNIFFIGNGVLILVFFLKKQCLPLFKKQGNIISNEGQITIFLISLTSFIALFAPFNATRHILLLIPFLLFLSDDFFDKLNKKSINLTLSSYIVLGLLLSVSDWFYADFYRKNTTSFKTNHSKTWSLGLWGWQWYSKKNGMEIYAKQKELSVKKGDYIIFPKDVPKQHLAKGIKIDTLKIITEKPNALTFFSGKNFASMYNSFYNKPAWSLSKQPIDTIFICKVIKDLHSSD